VAVVAFVLVVLFAVVAFGGAHLLALMIDECFIFVGAIPLHFRADVDVFIFVYCDKSRLVGAQFQRLAIGPGVTRQCVGLKYIVALPDGLDAIVSVVTDSVGEVAILCAGVQKYRSTVDGIPAFVDNKALDHREVIIVGR